MVEANVGVEPRVFKNAFNPNDVCGELGPASWINVLRMMNGGEGALQVHFEPRVLADEMKDNTIVDRALTVVSRLSPELRAHVAPGVLPDGKPKRARLKLRVSENGKFVHRNHHNRINVLMSLMGAVDWLLVPPSEASDRFFDTKSIEGLCGFRSHRFAERSSLAELQQVAATLRSEHGVESKLLEVSAGDVLMFDGIWWHATHYAQRPVFSAFVTTGEQMEEAVANHHDRMKTLNADDKPVKPRIATINRAKSAIF